MRRRRTSPKKGTARWSTRALKWVGAATAVFSLVIAAQQVGSWATQYLERGREAATLHDVARQQIARGEYATALATLDAAAEVRDGDGITAARADAAMAWLRESRPGPGKPFSAITDAAVPVLDRALVSAQGSRRADILAHLGWAAFLRGRDTGTGDPEPRYREALMVDVGNPFAHAMIGHWLLWSGGTLADARQHFEAALAAGREKAFVRRLQFAALRNRGQSADPEAIRIADTMRRQNETLDTDAADYIYGVYTASFRPDARTRPDSGVSDADAARTFEFVLRTPGLRARPLQEAARVREALSTGTGGPR